MAQHPRVQALSDGSELVSVLQEYFKNPKIIKQLSDDVVAINKLQAEEEHRLLEAKVLIQQRDSITSEIAQKKDELADMLAKHERKVKTDEARLDKKLADLSAELDARKTSLDERQADLDKEALRLHEKDIKLKSKADVIAGLAAD